MFTDVPSRFFCFFCKYPSFLYCGAKFYGLHHSNILTDTKTPDTFFFFYIFIWYTDQEKCFLSVSLFIRLPVWHEGKSTPFLGPLRSSSVCAEGGGARLGNPWNTPQSGLRFIVYNFLQYWQNGPEEKRLGLNQVSVPLAEKKDVAVCNRFCGVTNFSIWQFFFLFEINQDYLNINNTMNM